MYFLLVQWCWQIASRRNEKTVTGPRIEMDETILRVICEESIGRQRVRVDAELTDEATRADIVSATHHLARAVEMLSEM